MRLSRLICMVSALIALPARVFPADQKTMDLYKSTCQGCHGPDGKASIFGKKMGAKDFHDPDVARLSQADLVRIISDGKNKMPPYKGKLTDAEMKALARYIKEMK